jgi:hypothetical protein
MTLARLVIAEKFKVTTGAQSSHKVHRGKTLIIISL